MALETPIWLQGGTYSARQDRSLLDVIFTEGVIDPGGSALLVSERAAGANDTVDVAAGAAIITGDDEANQGKYYVRNTAVVNVAFTPAPGSDERIDLLVLQVNDPTAGGEAGDNATFVVIEGTVAETAVPPAVPDTAIPLAEVLRLSTDTTIVNARITDRRVASVLDVPVSIASLDDIGDVDLSGLADGDYIRYDAASGDWLAEAPLVTPAEISALDTRVDDVEADAKKVTFNAQTGTTYTLVLSDAGKLVTLSNASGITLTVPTNASVAFPTGSRVDIAQLGAGQVTVVGAAGVDVEAKDGNDKMFGQYSAATLISLGSDDWLMIGDLTT